MHATNSKFVRTLAMRTQLFAKKGSFDSGLHHSMRDVQDSTNRGAAMAEEMMALDGVEGIDLDPRPDVVQLNTEGMGQLSQSFQQPLYAAAFRRNGRIDWQTTSQDTTQVGSVGNQNGMQVSAVGSTNHYGGPDEESIMSFGTISGCVSEGGKSTHQEHGIIYDQPKS